MISTFGREPIEIEIIFSEALLPENINSSNFYILDPNQSPIEIAVQQFAEGEFQFVGLFVPPLRDGNYQLVIDAPNIIDFDGNALGSEPIVIPFENLTSF